MLLLRPFALYTATVLVRRSGNGRGARAKTTAKSRKSANNTARRKRRGVIIFSRLRYPHVRTAVRTSIPRAIQSHFVGTRDTASVRVRFYSVLPSVCRRHLLLLLSAHARHYRARCAMKAKKKAEERANQAAPPPTSAAAGHRAVGG